MTRIFFLREYSRELADKKVEGFIFCNSLMDINTENIEQEEQILLSLYKELSETHKRKAIDFLESLVEEETNEDIKHALLQAVQELLMGTR